MTGNIMEMTIVINVVVLMISTWAVMFVNTFYLSPIRIDKSRFILKKIKIDLDLLAKKGVIKEGSEEYKTLAKLIDGALRSLETFSFTGYLKTLYDLADDPGLKSHLNRIVKKVKSSKTPSEYQKLVAQFFEVSGDLYRKKVRLAPYFLAPLICFFGLLHVAKKINKFLKWQNKRITDVEHFLHENEERFAS